ncbi:MAG: LemA family protein [Bacteroidota bacterium]
MIYALVILVLLGLYAGSTYNKLVRARTMVEEGWSGIDVQLKKRYNLIPNLIETVKGYASHEKETLNRVIEARNTAQNATGVQATKAAEQQLQAAMANVFALAEAYPDLKANTNFLQLQNELSKIEDDVEKARRYYNGTVREKNVLVESFPSNLVANMFNFYLADFFEIDNATERAVPKVKF